MTLTTPEALAKAHSASPVLAALSVSHLHRSTEIPQ